MTFKFCFTCITLILILQSCGDVANSGSTDFSKSLSSMNGIYVSEGYTTRDDGSDWSSLSIIPINDHQAQMNIRSRVDNDKAATCTYASTASVKDANSLEASFLKNSILFSFDKNQVRISGAAENEASFLESFCVEGKSIAGTYTKLTEPLDDAQLLEGGFVKKLSMNGISFKIQAGSTGSSNSLLIQASGLTEDNQKIMTEIKGFITEAQVADLNGDAWPELLLFIDLGKSKKTGTVLAYSVNEGKTMSLVEYPNTFESDQISEGYMGQDKFSLKDNKLIQEFPVHTADGKLTNKTREVLYQLVKGSNPSFFEVEKVSDH